MKSNLEIYIGNINSLNPDKCLIDRRNFIVVNPEVTNGALSSIRLRPLDMGD